MKILVTLIVVAFPLATLSFQCYQCNHSETNMDIDCVNANVTHLQNCDASNQLNHDFRTKFTNASLNDKQLTGWTCLMRFTYTTVRMLEVIRQCIPKLDITICSSNGSFTETTLECICNEEGCNDFVVKLENGTTTPVTTTPVTTTTNVENSTSSTTSTSSVIGCSNITLPLSASYYFLVFTIFGYLIHINKPHNN